MQFLNGFGKYMRKVMACELKRVCLVAGGDQREVGVRFQRAHDIAHFAVDARGDRSLCKARTDGSRNVRRGSPPRDFTKRTIGKGDADHLGHWKKLLSVWIGEDPLPVCGAGRKGGTR